MCFWHILSSPKDSTSAMVVVAILHHFGSVSAIQCPSFLLSSTGTRLGSSAPRYTSRRSLSQARKVSRKVILQLRLFDDSIADTSSFFVSCSPSGPTFSPRNFGRDIVWIRNDLTKAWHAAFCTSRAYEDANSRALGMIWNAELKNLQAILSTLEDLNPFPATEALPAAEMSSQAFRKVGDRRGRAQIAAVLAETQSPAIHQPLRPFGRSSWPTLMDGLVLHPILTRPGSEKLYGVYSDQDNQEDWHHKIRRCH